MLTLARRTALARQVRQEPDRDRRRKLARELERDDRERRTTARRRAAGSGTE